MADPVQRSIDSLSVDTPEVQRGPVARRSDGPEAPGQTGAARPSVKPVAFPAPAVVPASIEGASEFLSEQDLALPAARDRDRLASRVRPATPRSPITRWALPALALIVIAETGWLVFDRLHPGAAPSPVTRAVPAAVPTSGSLSSAAVAPGAGVTTAPSQPVQPPTPAAAVPAQPVAATSSDIVAIPPGSVSIPLPFQVQVYQGTRFIGINQGNLPLTPGSHQLQLVNESIGFRTTERVSITSGRTTRLTPTVPTVRVQLNALPWAEVTVDGTSLGETPLGNVSMSVGPHTLVFRHPQFGEQTRNIVITTQAETRISVDLRK